MGDVDALSKREMIDAVEDVMKYLENYHDPENFLAIIASVYLTLLKNSKMTMSEAMEHIDSLSASAFLQIDSVPENISIRQEQCVQQINRLPLKYHLTAEQTLLPLLVTLFARYGLLKWKREKIIDSMKTFFKHTEEMMKVI